MTGTSMVREVTADRPFLRVSPDARRTPTDSLFLRFPLKNKVAA
jgi:hypothetical protein